MLGIIARDEERLQSKPKWYQFWKQIKDFELYYIEELGIQLVIVYDITRAQKIFAEHGVVNSVATCSMREKLRGVDYICFGDKFMRQLAIATLQNICDDKHNMSLAYIDEDLDDISLDLLDEIGRNWKSMYLVTNNILQGEKLADAILDEYGLAVEVQKQDGSFVSCDVAIICKGVTPKLSHEAIVINAVESENPRGRKIVGRENITVDDISRFFPFDLNNIDVTEALYYS